MKKILLALLLVSPAYAADLPAAKAPVVPTCPSTSQTLCNGWYVGLDVGATGTSGPINVNGGSGLAGASFGYKYWSGSWLIDADVEGNYDGTQGSPSGLFTETARFGGNLVGLFNGPPAPSQGPMVATFSNFTPYILAGVAERISAGVWSVGYETGAGVEGPLGGAWTWRTEYKYIKYTTGPLDIEQVGMASINYHFGH